MLLPVFRAQGAIHKRQATAGSTRFAGRQSAVFSKTKAKVSVSIWPASKLSLWQSEQPCLLQSFGPAEASGCVHSAPVIGQVSRT